MSTEEPTYTSPAAPPPPPDTARPRYGAGVAALVIGVASLVAVISFVLFPLGLLGGLLGIIIGIAALARGGETPNRGQATAGLICSIIAVLLAAVLTVRVGDLAIRNADTFTRFGSCIGGANDRARIADCIERFANDVRE
ncbi:MAG TPA: hypothetical protein VHI54_04525 [Actinomycetota bacterium]|nr:hypothetical protein [Actinomycetota bacterium]